MVHFGVVPESCLKSTDEGGVRLLLAMLPLICIMVNAGCLKLISATWCSYLRLGLKFVTQEVFWRSPAREMVEKRWSTSSPGFTEHSTFPFNAGGLRTISETRRYYLFEEVKLQVDFGALPKWCLRKTDQQGDWFLLAILLLFSIIISNNAGCLKLFSLTWHSYLCLGLPTCCVFGAAISKDV